MKNHHKSNFVNLWREIPVTAFGTSEINSYYQKVIEELHPTYYWNCQNCYKVVKSETKPESGLCEANSFYWDIHLDSSIVGYVYAKLVLLTPISVKIAVFSSDK